MGTDRQPPPFCGCKRRLNRHHTWRARFRGTPQPSATHRRAAGRPGCATPQSTCQKRQRSISQLHRTGPAAGGRQCHRPHYATGVAAQNPANPFATPAPATATWTQRPPTANGGHFGFLRTNKFLTGVAIAIFSIALISPTRNQSQRKVPLRAEWVIRQRVAQFLNSRSAGKHNYLWIDDTPYYGAWKDNKRNGQGTMTWPDGATYTGAWTDGKRNGQGTMTFPNGTKRTEEWANGQRVK